MQNVNVGMYIYLYSLRRARQKPPALSNAWMGIMVTLHHKSLHGNRYLTIRCWIILSHVPPLSPPP